MRYLTAYSIRHLLLFEIIPLPVRFLRHKDDLMFVGVLAE